MRARWVLSLFVVALAFGLTGCGNKSKLVKTSGVVTVDGSPLPGATVMFISAEGGPTASGRTGDDGSFTLSTFNSGDGVAAGDYKVVVKIDAIVEGSSPAEAGDSEALAKQMRDWAEEQKKKNKGSKKLEVHANYADPAKTPLKHRIPAEGKVELKLNKSGS